ncbi:MAG: LUD domain-containing protein [Candidatus Staskawiczbacteria bacterium]
MEKDFGQLATDESINKTKSALEKNGMQVFVVENGQDAKEKVLQTIPEGAETMNMSSVTIDSIGLAKEINESGKYNIQVKIIYKLMNSVHTNTFVTPDFEVSE